jgi:RHS repeat-associated protein
VTGTTTYTWDARGQLVAIAGPGGSASFAYDAFGRRVEKTVNGQTTGFLYDGAQAIAELRGSAVETVYHTGLAIDEVLARYAPTGNKTLLTDALQSVIAQANEDQTVGNYYAYSPYGEALALGPDEGNSLQYTGRENDGTGLYYYRARYYDPLMKRFISEDPIGIDGGLNVFAYVANNPVSFTDPFGLQVPVPGGGGAGTVGGGGAVGGAAGSRGAGGKSSGSGSVWDDIGRGSGGSVWDDIGGKWGSGGQGGGGGDDCEAECNRRYQTDVLMCTVARAFWGVRGAAQCYANAMQIWINCKKKCRGGPLACMVPHNPS